MRRFYRYELVDGQLVEKKPGSSAPVVHSIITDSMPDTWHPLTGEFMDSKSRFRSVTRSHGCTEVGNESFTPRQYRESSEAVIERCFREAKDELGM